jgi:hypothetical protein
MSLILDGTNGLSDVDGSASTPAIRGTDTNTGIFFPSADTIAFAEGGVEVARFDSSGNLGIGTSSPADKLEVNGIIRSNTLRTGATNRTLELYSGTAFNTGGAAVAIRGSTTGFNDNGMEFYTAGTERMRIDSSGNLLVGLTSGASYRLDVSSNGTTTARINRSTNTGNLIDFANGGGVLGNISTNGFSIAYNTTSDYRLKDNVVPMTGALDVVSALKPCTFTFKEGGQASQGFIAHELQAVVPECVTGEKDAVNKDGSINPQGIDVSFLVATLTAAIQEQTAIITDLKSRIEALEAK